ncbi:MAG: hypothetical protein KJ077_03580 [Anaerolineae bacterium]|nr:hypothetical protein [Anaerolineae bacterium]
MNTSRQTRIHFKSLVGLVGIGLAITVISLVALRLMAGRSLGLWNIVFSQIRFTSNLVEAVLDSQAVSDYSRGNFTNIIFLHHSTGRNLIEQGEIRARLAEAGYDFWDHDYNWPGLKRPNGSVASYNYNIPDDNTDPDGLARIFTQYVYGLPVNAFSGLLQHEIIVFKSCFPVSHITSDQQLESYQSYYLAIRDVMDRHPDRLFIVMTPPPLNPAETNPQAATRARIFANWLKSDEYLREHPNVFVFDFFGHLAEADLTSPDYNMLRREYREGSDSHPNRTANKTIGPLFVDFIIDAVEKYQTIYRP